jgi:DNA invertase Pin-like site-specific DNA recombinase
MPRPWRHRPASPDGETDSKALVPAAAYVRMSTEHQRYSADNQMDEINRYAAQRGYDVVRVYADLGKSGLTLEGRVGLQQLLADVATGATPYRALLVYDVSRWGRFQDPDEAAACELSCKHAGLAVHYCAEPFENDGSITSSIVKALKRVMAGEYSRELSEKTFRGQAGMVRRGFRPGGRAGYGFRRRLIDADGATKRLLETGEQKAIRSERIALALGPKDEVRAVRRVYRLFLEGGKSELEIARLLAADGTTPGDCPAWTKALVREILTNEKYIGNAVWGRWTKKLKGKLVRANPDHWVRREGSIPRIVSTRQFRRAQAIFEARKIHLTDEDVLERLRDLLAEKGYLSSALINQAGDGLSCGVVRYRFKSTRRLYAALGYQNGVDIKYSAKARQRRHIESLARTAAIERLEADGLTCSIGPEGRILHSPGLAILFSVMKGYLLPSGNHSWIFHLERHPPADIVVLLRLVPGGDEVMDYLVVPIRGSTRRSLSFTDNTPSPLDAYRSSSLEPLYKMIASAGSDGRFLVCVHSEGVAPRRCRDAKGHFIKLS